VTRTPQPEKPDQIDEIVAAIVAALCVNLEMDGEPEPSNWRSALAVVADWSATSPAAWRNAERRRGWRS
jgi:hypothetical protein